MKCIQTCHECRDDRNRPKKWLWNCPDCYEDHEQKHRQETGHTVETLISSDEPKKVFGMIADAGRLMGRRGGW